MIVKLKASCDGGFSNYNNPASIEFKSLKAVLLASFDSE